MATRETTLGDWGQPSIERAREEVLSKGARYGKQTARQYEPEPDTRVCLNCGEDISREIARVCGDSHDCVPCCKHCAHNVLPRGKTAYTSTAKAVHKFRGEAGL